MDIKLGRLFWEITGDSAKLVQSMVQANNETQKFGSSMQKFGAKMSLFVTAPLLGIGGAALKSAADLEQSRIAFETMLGSAEAAQSLLKDIEQFAASTPFEMPGLVNGAKRLLAFGVSAGDVVEKMRNLGNAASGNSDQLDRLILAYGKLQAKGRASMEELNMFTEAGVPIIKALEKQMGVTTEELFKMISAGKIQFSDVDQALTSLTTGSGQFAGLIEKQSKTFSGALSTFKDNLSLAGRALVEGFLPPLTELLVKATKMVEGFSKLDDGTKKIILAGAAFLALIGPLATGIGTAIKVVSALKVAMVLLNSAMLANPVLAIITGIVAAGIAIGKVVSDIKKTTAELKEARTFDVTDDLDANIAKLAAFKKEVQDAFNRAAAATGREREMLRGSALQLASQYRLMEQQVEVQQAQFEEMDQVKRLQDKRLEQEQAITMEQQKQVVLQEELAAKVEQKYLDARAAVLDVLNSEKTEVQLLQEEIERLEKTPWGSGALEEDRLKAIAILRDRQRAAVAAEIEEREAAIKAEVEAYEAGVSEQEALDREATLESLTHAKELDKIDEENKQKAIDRVEEINNARLEAFQSAYNLASKLNDALSMLSDNELANQESAFNKKAELINAELDKQIQAGIEAGLITQKTLSYEEQLRADAAAKIQKERDKLDAQKREAALKDFKRNKALSLAQVAIDTARAIIGFLANPGGLAGVGLSLSTAAISAAQIAAIVSQPPPALAEGGVALPTPGGRIVKVAEAKSAEAIIPLNDQGRDFVREAIGTPSASGGDKVSVPVSFTLDGFKEIMFGMINVGLRNGEIVADARKLTNLRAAMRSAT